MKCRERDAQEGREVVGTGSSRVLLLLLLLLLLATDGTPICLSDRDRGCPVPD